MGPGIFVFDQDLNQLLVIFQLRVHDLYILFVLAQEVSEVLKTFLDPLG